MLTAHELVALVESRGIQLRREGTKLHLEPGWLVSDEEWSDISQRKSEVIEVLAHRERDALIYAEQVFAFAEEPAAAILFEAESYGCVLGLRKDREVGIRFASQMPTSLFGKLTLVRTQLTELLLMRKASKLSQAGKVCRSCRKLASCYSLEDKSFVCPACAEWRCLPRHSFTITVETDDNIARRFGCCLKCGCSWDFHGEPAIDFWTYVHADENVEILNTETVRATAFEIQRKSIFA